MLILTKSNLLDYLKSHYPPFDTTGKVTISAIGDDEDDLKGVINYIFRAANEKESIIIKQGRDKLRIEDDGLTEPRGSAYVPPPERNFMEYRSLRLRSAIAPEYVPKTYYVDRENNLFIMEDVGKLKPSRLTLSRNIAIPGLGRRVGEFLADIHFYTSEFYMDTEEFRTLGKYFTNSGMRRIMENWLFLRETPTHERHKLTVGFQPYIFDPAVVRESHILRHKYMGSAETFIHSDLHTSNIFANADELKVIDMEYTFAGPCAYDLGYLLGSLFSQFTTALFRPFAGEGERRDFAAYMLREIEELFYTYRARFSAHWEEEAKELYRESPEYREAFLDGIIPDTMGYAAMPMFNSCISPYAFPTEFGMIQEEEKLLHALRLYCIEANDFLMRRETFRTPSDVTDRAWELAGAYLKSI